MSGIMSFDPVFLRLQTLLAGRFSLERELGRGGMGIVYLARDVALERPVAIKLLAPELSVRQEMRSQFLREARIAAQCFHPHIVPIHAVEAADDLAWIVMAYVRGETLSDRLRRDGPLPAHQVRRLAREVGWALSYAHQRGVVHRDIKPENLLIDASTDRYVIADFGIALRSDELATPTPRAMTGTARYMAPEQALSEPIDGRADLYALGVTLFVAATGRPPFDGANSMALVVQHASQPAPSVRQYAPSLPLSLVRAIDRCLAKSPEGRFRDAGAFLAAVEQDVLPPELPPVFGALREHASATRTMLAWSTAIALTSILLVAGEAPDSLGRAISGTIGQGMTLLFVAATLLRGGETLFESRRLLRLGHPDDDITRTLVPANVEQAGRTGLVTGIVQVVAGASLSYGQGQLGSIALPGLLESVMQIGAILVPPMLIARGSHRIATSTGFGNWLRDRVGAPLARFAVQMASLGLTKRPQAPPIDDAPTEMLLVRAVDSMLDEMPAQLRAQVSDANAIARALAGQAAAFRREARQLDGVEAEALMRGDSRERAAALDDVRSQQAAVTARLQTCMAALESLRLDIVRLAVVRSDTGLTSQVEAAEDVHRRVDAVIDVHRYLDEATPT